MTPTCTQISEKKNVKPTSWWVPIEEKEVNTILCSHYTVLNNKIREEPQVKLWKVGPTVECQKCFYNRANEYSVQKSVIYCVLLEVTDYWNITWKIKISLISWVASHFIQTWAFANLIFLYYPVMWGYRLGPSGQISLCANTKSKII